MAEPFFINPDFQKEYETRFVHYKLLLEEYFPDSMDWRVDCVVIKEMVRAELELERLDRVLGNGSERQPWMFRERKNLREAVGKYRRDLLLIHCKRKGHGKQETKKPKTLSSLLPNDDYKA